MEFEPFGRRELFAGAGGLFLCTLGGQKVVLNQKADVDRLAADIKVPPKVKAAERAGAYAPAARPRR